MLIVCLDIWQILKAFTCESRHRHLIPPICVSRQHCSHRTRSKPVYSFGMSEEAHTAFPSSLLSTPDKFCGMITGIKVYEAEACNRLQAPIDAKKEH
jgi:hypothetical protein